MALTARQELFCLEYLKDLNATQAAIRAGYARDSAHVEGSRLLANDKVQVQIGEAAAARLEKVEVSAALVLRELLALATVDTSAAYDEDGNLKNIHDIPLVVRKAIAGVETQQSPSGMTTVKKLKFWDRTKALEMLGRHIQLFKDTLALTGPDGGPIEIDDHTRRAKIEAIYAAAARRKAGGEDLV